MSRQPHEENKTKAQHTAKGKKARKLRKWRAERHAPFITT